MTTKKPRVSPLKSCPFCVGKPYLHERPDERAPFAVACNDCGAQGPWTKTREDAVTGWNRRAS